MKQIISLTALMSVATIGNAYAGPNCSNMPHDVSLSSVVKNFEDASGRVKLAKITSDNCYEIYGEINGQRFEIYYNPTTGAELQRNEG